MNVWILKRKKDGKYIDCFKTRNKARNEIKLLKYYQGFGYKELIIVKAIKVIVKCGETLGVRK